MSSQVQRKRDRLVSAAEGYLALGMAEHALSALREIEDPGDAKVQIDFLKGDALRHLERHADALRVFEKVFAENPENVSLLMAMAWCYKRTDQLSKAITAMEQAYRISPKEAVILYNLSCYWSLAGNKTQALSWLGRALRMDGSFRNLIPNETDFDPLRKDPDFQMIVDPLGEATRRG